MVLAMTSLRFADIQAPTPDLDALGRQHDGLLAELDAAAEVEAALAVLTAWDAMRREFSTWSALVDLAFNQDTADAAAVADKDLRSELTPRWVEQEVGLKRAFLDHPLRPQLEARVGAQVFALWEVDVLAFDPALKDELVSESKLESEYIGLLAGAEMSFQGETLTHSTIGRYRQHPDREVRHGAERVLWSWFSDQVGELDRIYGDLVSLRTGMARQLGFKDFVGMGYKRMSRVDYSEADVERFRAQVREHVVPLAADLARQQGERLGVDTLMAWDEPVSDPDGNPVPQGDHDELLLRAQEMFDAMGSGLGAFFRKMNEGGFLDLRSRGGKAGGGFCTSFPTVGMPFVFANFNGTKGDVEVFTHEIGHAFQCYSSRDKAPIDYGWPTLDACEIHSMSLEFLTWPHMERFFGDDAERFRKLHLAESLSFLPYGVAVDHFQHLVYGNPDATPEQRHGMWKEMEAIYLPWRNWGDLQHPAMGGRWQLQRHIYLKPFYYIDYVLAQTCALQFLARARHEPEQAMSAYVTLCGRGGEAPFQELARSAGLVSPFDDGCLASVAAEARAALEG
jgi:M3 family oligoendopeptidase